MTITNTDSGFEDAVLVQDEPTPQTKELAITKFGQSTNLNQMLSDAQVLLDGKFVPPSIKTPQALVSIVKMGQELGMDTMASINNLVVIQGKPTLGIHAIGALLDKAGVEKQTIEDFLPIMGEEGTENAGKVVDYRTTIRFTQKSRFGGIITEDVSFTWKEATKMDLTSKDNWKRMPKIMLWSRCMSLGARRAAPAAMLGMMEVSEWADVANQKYKVSEEGEATLL